MKELLPPTHEIFETIHHQRVVRIIRHPEKDRYGLITWNGFESLRIKVEEEIEGFPVDVDTTPTVFADTSKGRTMLAREAIMTHNASYGHVNQIYCGEAPELDEGPIEVLVAALKFYIKDTMGTTSDQADKIVRNNWFGLWMADLRFFDKLKTHFLVHYPDYENLDEVLKIKSGRQVGKETLEWGLKHMYSEEKYNVCGISHGTTIAAALLLLRKACSKLNPDDKTTFNKSWFNTSSLFRREIGFLSELTSYCTPTKPGVITYTFKRESLDIPIDTLEQLISVAYD